MSEKGKLRKAIKKEARNLVKENRWNLVLGNLVVGSASASSSYGVGLVLTGPLTLGLANYELKLLRNEESNTGDLFKGFKNFGRAVVLFLLEFIYLCLWTLLFIIPGIIKSYSYAMSFYILKDNPEMEAKEAITKSREMMKGHKWELFVLQLSFIGWILLTMLTFGILGVFFVGPWMNLTYAKFYESIK